MRGATAAAAGLGALALFVVSGIVCLFSLAYGRVNPVGLQTTAPDPTAVNHVGMLVLAPTITVVRTMLPLAATNAVAPAIAATVGAAGRGLTETGSKTLLAATAAFFVLGFAAFGYDTVWGFVVVLPAWVALPTIAGLNQTR